MPRMVRTEVAAADGLDFRFDRIRPGNTFDAHRLLHLAGTRGAEVQDAVKERFLRGYMTEEANVIGTESRTSAPVRVPRNPDNLMHPEVSGLFPCGEGAGYAGGIVSAAMDGERVMDSVAALYPA